MANTMTLEFAGDADKLKKASKQATAAVDDVAAAARDADKNFRDSGAEAERYGKQLGNIGEATTGAIDAIGAMGEGMQALADIQDAARQKAARLAQASNDVAQAQEDMAQATRDAKQAQIDSSQAAVDLEQAQLDQKTALDEYNAAVKEHGKNSDEARQAQIDLKQAGIDVRQAHEDAAQATRDANQANIDARQGQLDLNEAMHEANPPQLQQWADQVNMIAPLLSALVGVVGLVTAAQWAWNAAQLASPTTWIILAILALIAVIVLIATKTDWFQRAWKASWNWIKMAASNTWDFLKKIPGWLGKAFSAVADFLTAPFRRAFNGIRNLWNSTIGGFSFSIPGWVPGIGGNSITIPRFHSGIDSVPGPAGSEMLAILHAGERVIPAGAGAGGDMVHVVLMVDSGVLADAVVKGTRRRFGAGGG